MKSSWADVHPFTGALPTVEDAKSDALADPRTALHGKVQILKGDGSIAKFWKQERHAATVTILDTGESKVLEAASDHDLREQLLHLQQTLMAQHLQAQVVPEEPREVWVADLTYDDGSGERAEANTYDDLLATLLSWTAKTPMPGTASPHLPMWDLETTEEVVAAQQFRDLAGAAYKPTRANAEKLKAYLYRHNLAVTVKNLVIAFHALNDAGRLEE